MGRLLAALFAGLTAIVVLAAGAYGYVMWRFEAPGPLAEEAVVEIPRGAGLTVIADHLAEAGVVRDRWLFMAGVVLNRKDRALKAGEFAFPAGASPEQAMAILESGRTVSYVLTVPEGLTSAEVVALLAAEDRLVGEITEVPPDGALLPETYSFHRNDTREAVLARMAAAMDAAIAELWPQRAEGLPLATPEEAVVLASIIEKETGVPAERRLVAGVFTNRLRRGMMLQSDPTVIYALTGGRGPLGRALLRADLATESPYNTYRVTGLPPGPIANPGRASLAAALDPADTEYLYFVADGTGGHVFARTLDEHNRNAANWRRIRDQQTPQQTP